MKDKANHPYKAFGNRIKSLREQWHQTLGEVSDTLEIKEDLLKSIEAGNVLPEHNLLDMLISHFLLTEDQAEDLRDLAGLDEQTDNESSSSATFEDFIAKQVVMYLPVDNRIIYTDGMHANVNDHGVILQFMQQTPSSQQPNIVSKIGMSREHAEKVIKVLKQTLEQYDANKKQKSLPSPDSDKS